MTAVCEKCGVMRVSSSTVTIYVDEAKRDQWCEYRCSKCKTIGGTLLSGRTTLALISHGARLHIIKTPAEVLEQHWQSKPTSDDILGFLDALKDEGFNLDQVIGVSDGGVAIP